MKQLNSIAIILFYSLSVPSVMAQGPSRANQEGPNPLIETIKNDLDRVFEFLNANTPAKLVDRESGEEVANYKNIDKNTTFQRGRFGLYSYEWGVTYSGMLKVAEDTGDKRYSDYVNERFNFVGDIHPYFVKLNDDSRSATLRGLIRPIWLDDCGSIQAAFVKGVLANPKLESKLRPIIDIAFDFAMNKEHRLHDRTLARLRPTRNSVWVDDMYMGIPPIAYMGKLVESEDPELAQKYYDEAALQIELFAKHLWIPEKKLFRHSWIEHMSFHPSLFWGRANGWALLAMSDVLDVLPENHFKRQEIKDLLTAQIHGFMPLQGGDGFFHQLLDHNDSYTETSVTAMYAYTVAHGINEGWLDIQAYGPSAVAAWKAVATRINEAGEVEGTCVGTGVAYEPGFYYKRPTSVNAAHGYGPVFLAGNEVMKMLKDAPRFY